jgi:4-diphosphocytidyl-2-C-methyl-D-erythritol kinase
VLSTSAHAKLNLLLNVLGRFPNGYHDLEMVNISIDLADEISIEPAAAPAVVVRTEFASRTLEASAAEPVPLDDRNIALQALKRVCAAKGVAPNFRVTIVKRIPVGAGLAGGSTDAAAVLRLMGDGVDNLDAIALEIGADVPFCLQRAPAIVRGVGERITPIRVACPLYIALVNPGFAVATKSIFQAVALDGIRARGEGSRRSGGDRLASELASGDVDRVARCLENDLQSVTTRLHPAVAALINDMRAAGAAGALMSGSGPSVFGLFRDSSAARGAAAWFAPRVSFARACEIVS